MDNTYHDIEKEGNPTENGYYMVKFHIAGMPVWDCIEIAFRNFVDGAWDTPYYSNPDTDTLVGWYSKNTP